MGVPHSVRHSFLARVGQMMLGWCWKSGLFEMVLVCKYLNMVFPNSMIYLGLYQNDHNLGVCHVILCQFSDTRICICHCGITRKFLTSYSLLSSRCFLLRICIRRKNKKMLPGFQLSQFPMDHYRNHSNPPIRCILRDPNYIYGSSMFLYLRGCTFVSTSLGRRRAASAKKWSLVWLKGKCGWILFTLVGNGFI